MHRFSLYSAVILLFASAAHADDVLSIKPGRWLVTESSVVNNVDYMAKMQEMRDKSMQAAKSKMSAEQRAQFEQYMAGNQLNNNNVTHHYECIKPSGEQMTAQKAMNASMHSLLEDDDDKCTYADQHADSSGFSFSYTCQTKAGAHQQGVMKAAYSDQSYSMTMHGQGQVAGAGSKTMSFHSDMRGKWVSSTCQPGDETD